MVTDSFGGKMQVKRCPSYRMVRRSRRNSFLTSVIASVMVLALGVLGAAPANAALTPDICEFGVAIGVRGTDAPAGTPWAGHGGRLYGSGGWGDQLNQVPIHAGFGGIPWFAAALNYPASGGVGFVASIDTGTSNLVAELNYLATACGSYLPAVVLLGHSQGAIVVLNALASPNLSANARRMVRGAAVFGDPYYTPWQAINAPGSQNLRGGFLGQRSSAVRSVLDSYQAWGWLPDQTGEGWVHLIRSYCSAGDYFCANNATDAGMTIHNSYKSNNIVYGAWLWLEDRVTDPS